MERRLNRLFFLRRHANGQQVHEKVNTNYQGNANQNSNEI